MTKNYIKPEMEIVEIHLEGAVLSASTVLGASGEDIDFGDEFNPWK